MSRNDIQAGIDRIITAIEEAAQSAEMNAGMSGERHDGGASRLRDQVRFYSYGRAGTIPPEWAEYKKHTDPEYAEYVRLKNKFGGR